MSLQLERSVTEKSHQFFIWIRPLHFGRGDKKLRSKRLIDLVIPSVVEKSIQFIYLIAFCSLRYSAYLSIWSSLKSIIFFAVAYA